MRYLLAVLMLAPVFAQTTEQTKPDAAAAQQPAKADEKAADQKPAESPAPATDNWFTGGVDLGYRWLINQQGNFQQYRSVVNLGEGPKLLDLNFTVQDPKKRLFDRVDARANSWGGDPYNTAHIDAVKQGVYRFTADYRNIAYFNAIPSFANPFAPAGFDEQSFDIHRRNTMISLDLFPARRIQPYLVYERNSGSGSGVETWVQDANNEYPVPAEFRDSTNNYRGGVHVETNRFHVTLEEGGTTYKNNDSAFQNTQIPGNRTTPLLGQNLFLNGLVQQYGIRGDSTYSKILATGHVTNWLDVYGQFLYSNPHSNVSYSDLAYGNFAQVSTLLFYSSQMNLASGTAVQPHILANGGFEIRPLNRLRIVESVMLDHSHDAASPFTTQQILGSGVNQAIVAALNYHQVVNYNQQQVDVIYDLTNKLTLRGGYRFVWGDSTVLASQLSQTGLLEYGELHRNIALAGLTYRPIRKLTINLDYEGASSDNIYFRTSLNDYDRGRARASYQATNSLSVQTQFRVLDNRNPDPTVRLDFLSRDNGISFLWTPNGGKRISVMGEYDRSTVRSNILYLDLFLVPSVSAYRDDAHTATSAVTLAIPRYDKAKLTFGGSLFISSGSRPTRYYQPLGRLSVPVNKYVAWNTEWQWYGYGEAFYLYEGFRTHVFMTGLRITK